MLEEDVYQHFRLARGVPYAISTMLHYVILVLGFFVALGALGIDLTKLTILVGAFTVGIGLVTFPAASAIFSSPAYFHLSSTQYGGMFEPQATAATHRRRRHA